MTKPYPTRTPQAIAERRQQIITLSRQGVPVREICDRVGVGHFTVVAVRRAVGISKPRAPRMTGDEIERARALLDDGCSLAEAARTIGRSHQQMSRLFPGRGWSMKERDEHTATVRRYEKQGFAISIDTAWREKKWAVEEWKKAHPEQYAREVEDAWATHGRAAL